MRFELKAITQEGRIEALDFQALDEAGARQQAEGRGYTVLTLRRKSGLLEGWRAGERFPVALFSQELLVLLDSGLPLVEAIVTLSEKERHAGSRAVLEHIAGNLKDMFRGIGAVGNDVIRRGSRYCGSILIDRMTIAGD